MVRGKTALFNALAAALLAAGPPSFPAQAQTHVEAGRGDLAELAMAATTVVRAEVEKAREIKAERAPGLAPGFRRFYVEAQVLGVLAAPAAVPGEIRYLVDLPETSRGRAPDVEGAAVLLFLGPEQRPGEYALAHRKGQQPWSPAAESVAKRFLQDKATLATRGGDLAVTGAFHVRGTVPGESESQIFVRGADGNPASLVVLRRPGQQPRVAVVTGDIIDPDAPPPDPQALSSVLFACGLPASLPDEAVASERQALARDYAAAIAALGSCDRRFEPID